MKKLITVVILAVVLLTFNTIGIVVQQGMIDRNTRISKSNAAVVLSLTQVMAQTVGNIGGIVELLKLIEQNISNLTRLATNVSAKSPDNTAVLDFSTIGDMFYMYIDFDPNLPLDEIGETLDKRRMTKCQ